MAQDVLVIGGSNIDYAAFSQKKLILGDSNIGKIKTSFGGVGRNLVENLARLGHHVTFLTAIGNDPQGKQLKEELESLSVRVLTPSYSKNTSSYLAIYGEDSDMHVAVCDSEILDSMKVEDLLPFEDIIDSFQSIILDMNLNQEVIDWIFSRYQEHHSILIEAVSANKVSRIQNHLSHLSFYKSNLLEARYLLHEEKSAAELLSLLLKKGVKRAVISDSCNGIEYGDENGIHHFDVIPLKKIVSANGAGDALFAGILHALLEEKTLKEAVAFGDKAAKKALSSPEAVATDIADILKD